MRPKKPRKWECLGPCGCVLFNDEWQMQFNASKVIKFKPRHLAPAAASTHLSYSTTISFRGSGTIGMGFLVTTLIFVVIGIIACLLTRICCNKGPSANLFHLTLVITATICCWMMWAIVYLAQMKPLIVPILNEGE